MKAVRVLLQFLASAAGGALLGLVGGLAGSALGKGIPNGFADLVGGILVGALGYVIGAGLAASLAGRRLGQPTSCWLALVSSLGAGILVVILAEPLHLNASPLLLRAVFAIAVPLAATLIPGLTARAQSSQ